MHYERKPNVKGVSVVCCLSFCFFPVFFLFSFHSLFADSSQLNVGHLPLLVILNQFLFSLSLSSWSCFSAVVLLFLHQSVCLTCLPAASVDFSSACPFLLVNAQITASSPLSTANRLHT